ncbi:MAG: hypothetical protein ACYC2P_12260 [Paludibacteraceae bacterium]
MRNFLQWLLSELFPEFPSNDEPEKFYPKTGKDSMKGPPGSGYMICVLVTKLTNWN